MKNVILPLADWGMGTAIIIFFAVLCVALPAIVLAMVFSGKKKKNDKLNSSQDENL